MQRIQLLSPDGSQEEVTETELRLRFEKGLLDSEAVYWRRGMPDWRPVTDFVSSFRPSDSGILRQLPYSLESHAATLRGMLLALAISEALDLVVAFGPQAEGFTDYLGVVPLILFLATAVAFPIWVYRTAHNVRALGAIGLTFSPAAAVAWYFVPVAWLVVPYVAMKELVKASVDPVRWPIVKMPGVLHVWWGTWVLFNLLSVPETRLAFQDPPVTIPLLSGATAVLHAGSALALRKLIGFVQDAVQAHLGS
jgi:hypothetical protein